MTRTYRTSVADDVMSEVSTWFRSRGFELAVSDEGATWWASLTPIGNPASVVRYGSGDTPETAALRARNRYEQEQLGQA
jgi:hypothetical protein